MRYLLKSLYLIILLGSLNNIFGQTKTAVNTVLTADSLASGNTKEILTSFFQLSFNSLTGKNRELNFSSSPYAVLLKTNPTAALDINYPKYKFLRKLNFSFGLKLDTAYKFNGFSSGVKYALIDNRDATISPMLKHALFTDTLFGQIDELQDALVEYMEENIPNDSAHFEERMKFNETINDFLANAKKPYKALDDSFKKIVKNIIKYKNLTHLPDFDTVSSSSGWSLRQAATDKFAKLKDEIKNNLLWTVSLSDSTYKNEFSFSNVVLKTELLKGLGKPRPGSNWEFNVQAALNFIDDTTVVGRDLKRSIFSFEPAFNYVLRSQNTDKSYLELKFSGEYNHIFKRLYPNEKKNSFTFNGTARLKIFNEIWLPLEFKYDPKNGNVFGFISAKFNFSALAKTAK